MSRHTAIQTLSRTGGILPHLVDLAVFPSDTGSLVANRPSAPVRGQHPDGGICHSVSFSPQPYRAILCPVEKVELHGTQGPILHVAGADLMDGTPIYDIKPYLPYTDAYPDAKGGFSFQQKKWRIGSFFPHGCWTRFPAAQQKALLAVLAQDPRPAYQHQPNRIYGMPYADFEVRFTVDGNRLTVCGLTHRRS